MKSLMKQVRETHMVTETDHGNYCWTCTLATGTDTAYPCPTLVRAEELDAIAPLDPPEPEPAPEPAPTEPAPADPPSPEA